MRVWIMQVKVPDETRLRMQWTPVRPSNGPVYKFKTKAEAADMLRICYGDPANTGEVRILEIEDHS